MRYSSKWLVVSIQTDEANQEDPCGEQLWIYITVKLEFYGCFFKFFSPVYKAPSTTNFAQVVTYFLLTDEPRKAGDMNSPPPIAASVGLGILIFVLTLSIVGIAFLRRYLKTLNGPKPSRKLGTCITSKEPPAFLIPPYTLITEESDGGETMSEYGETLTEEDTANLSPPWFRRALSMPSGPLQLGNNQRVARCEEGELGTAGISTKEFRPQYRRAVSQFAPQSAQMKREPARKVSAAPYGKLEVSLQFVTAKNLLIIQVSLLFSFPLFYHLYNQSQTEK